MFEYSVLVMAAGLRNKSALELVAGSGKLERDGPNRFA
jgi:hypothetical protein